MKTKQEIEKEFDKQFNIVKEWTTEPDNIAGNVAPKIKDFISQLRSQDADEIVKWAEGRKKLIPDDRYRPGTDEEAYNIAGRAGFNQALSDLIDYITSNKRNI